MTFRFSEFAKRGKSGNPWSEADNSTGPSRPMTANSYDFRPSPRQPSRSPPPPIAPRPAPSRNDTPLLECSYDNGTGRLDPRLAREQGLPATIQTTDQLADFIKTRYQEQTYSWSPSLASQYSYVPDSPATGLYRRASRRGSRPSFQSTRTTSNPIVAGLRNKYATPPVDCVLPGATRRHKYEGFWLARGTMRKTEADMKDRNKRWKKAREERPASSNGPYVETSGWYD
ncbi:hypothetical protein A1O7_04430 [Cladophialophora yegresii CBS 114405]|uniref:Uncharacterized protein n=1 Tax=Cladophialophora yegresii CBS 114405 TaxID=1182544 RepID=W9VX61_9EURO|nr:uncharacterized protein A1O7_04430 [Cladophialophora yegresii CBS 114405]EXJ60278.1 hypothetical protein A1O7_04430 [Cladophialophora yegresii CBS 114405]